ncbi:MAG: hypothetical protein AB1540_00380 [Bdellovibrionota bacterium]
MKILLKKKLGNMRRQFLVNEPFQLRFLAFCGLTALIACGLFYATSCYFFAKYTGYAIEAGLRSSDPFFRVLSNMEDLLTWFFAIVSGATILFTTVAGLAFSNRVAGPMLRLRNHCERVAKGETLDGIKFRDGDYFEEVAEAYNRQMEYMRSRMPAGAVEPSSKAADSVTKKAA